MGTQQRRRGAGQGAGQGLGSQGLAAAAALKKGNKKYGVVCLGGGTVVTMLGMTLMFERNLMRLGNLLQVAGLALLMGPPRLVRYLLQKSKLRGTTVFSLGFLLMLNGRPFVGMILELFGIINLFGNMFPMVWAVVQRMPIVKELFRDSGGKAGGRGARRPQRGYDRDSGYDDQQPYGGDDGDRGYYDDRQAPADYDPYDAGYDYRDRDRGY